MESDAAMKAQNEEMMSLVMEQYNNMSVSMEEEKKAKLEQLYDQIVSFQESIDSAKAALETASREADTDACVSTDTSRAHRSCLLVDWWLFLCLINPSSFCSTTSHLKTFTQGKVLSVKAV